jgi:hypothetical protein
MGETTTYDAYLEVQPDGRCLAQIVDLPGCFASGAAESAVLTTLIAAIPPYYQWLSRHDDYTPIVSGPFQVEVRERLVGSADPCAACAFFAPDGVPVTPDDLDWLLSLVEWANADLVALVEAGPTGLAGAGGVLRHVAEGQVRAASEVLGTSDSAPLLLNTDDAQVLRQVAPWLRSSLGSLPPEQLAAVTLPNGQERSVRWALRRAIVHARAHAAMWAE